MRLHTISAAALAAAFLFGAPAMASQTADKTAHPPGHKMDTASEGAAPAAMDGHCGMPMGKGVINALDVKTSKATIAHGPIAAIGWGKMTMTFAVAKPVDLAAFAPKDKVHFLLKEVQSKKTKTYSIAAMCSLDAASASHEACMGQMHKTAMALADEAGTPCPMDDMEMKGMDHGAKDPDAKAGEDHDGHH